jgi:quercetin dioxygenase-like cupin family protein
MMPRFSSSTLAVLLAAPFSALLCQSSPVRTHDDSETVVFVCEHGTVKSVVAMAYFTRLTGERGLPIRAISRGTALEPRVPAPVRDGLRADGLSLGSFTPTPFTPADLGSAIAVVSFDQPGVAATVAGRVPTSAWDGLPAVSENYAVARDSIRLRVAGLVDSLARARAATQSQGQMSLFPPAEIQWKDGPPSLRKGVQMAVLEGDPSKPGTFTIRFRFPAGFEVMPHFHTQTEHATVISGVLHLGMGDRFDKAATRALAAGSFGYWPAGTRHFAWMEGETILQLHGQGPWTVTYVNPTDDPRKTTPR